jgi:hypothetical protein
MTNLDLATGYIRKATARVAVLGLLFERED